MSTATHPGKRITDVKILHPLDHSGHATVSVTYGNRTITMSLHGSPALSLPFSVTDVRISARGGVTTSLLREIPIEMCRQRAVRALIGPMPDLEPMVGLEPTNEVLEAVLETYRLAEMHDVPAYHEVKKRFGISAATATRWIARAKEEHNGL